jgi:acetoin:2,6-dichlorophenolindophenol oxidoreductase subunit beta
MARKTTYIQALQQAIDEEMTRDDNVFLMGEDVVAGTFGVTSGLVNKFGPERIRNTPISEAGFVGAGLGAAIAGSRPIVEIEFAAMVYMAFDQLVNQIAKARYMSGDQVSVPLTIRAAVAMGLSAGAQHSDTPHALFAHMPGLKVVVPSGPRDAKGLLKTAIRDEDPVMFLESMALAATKEELPDEEELIPFGQANLIHEGDDLTIVALGSAVPSALVAANRLREEGVSVELLDPRTIVPMDWQSLFASARKTGRVVVVDDATPLCSFASEAAASIGEYCFDDLRAPVRRVTRENVPVPFSPPMEQHILLNADKVDAACRSILAMERSA